MPYNYIHVFFWFSFFFYFLEVSEHCDTYTQALTCSSGLFCSTASSKDFIFLVFMVTGTLGKKSAEPAGHLITCFMFFILTYFPLDNDSPLAF